jgi:hypothetical protein
MVGRALKEEDEKMKTKNFAPPLTWILALALFACGANEEPAPPAAPPATESTPPDAPAGKRTLVESRAMGTRPDNLVLDPTFSTLDEIYGNAIYRSEDTDLRVEVPATSPAGIAQPVLVVKGSGIQPMALLGVQAGSGPLDVSIFVSIAEGKKTPPLTITSLEGTKSFALEATTTTERHGERTYKLYRTRIDETVLGKLYLLIEPGNETVTVSKPEVIKADPTKKPSMQAHVVALGPNAARAVRAFASRPVIPGPPTLAPKIRVTSMQR